MVYQVLHVGENKTSDHTHSHGLLVVFLAANEMGYFRTDIHREFPAVACDPLLHLVMSTTFSKVASDSDGELFQWIFHGGRRGQSITLHRIKKTTSN